MGDHVRPRRRRRGAAGRGNSPGRGAREPEPNPVLLSCIGRSRTSPEGEIQIPARASSAFGYSSCRPKRFSPPSALLMRASLQRAGTSSVLQVRPRLWMFSYGVTRSPPLIAVVCLPLNERLRGGRSRKRNVGLTEARAEDRPSKGGCCVRGCVGRALWRASEGPASAHVERCLNNARGRFYFLWA